MAAADLTGEGREAGRKKKTKRAEQGAPKGHHSGRWAYDFSEGHHGQIAGIFPTVHTYSHKLKQTHSQEQIHTFHTTTNQKLPHTHSQIHVNTIPSNRNEQHIQQRTAYTSCLVMYIYSAHKHILTYTCTTMRIQYTHTYIG